MVALTYDVRTVRIPVPRLALRTRAPRRTPRPRVVLEPWQRAEREAAERRHDAHRSAALALHR
ncbi:hypothetical protein HP550_18495 [Cellulomonas humilata]|uniref:Uncharacterized protein n=1 Tax=Cellulomonas humilata TaxID=144055 RepID=A0A7Y6A3T3_9CELL|nr:hypothetical protein [Cellulomonas humilata]NUU19243.1 hypothetical protein [Cellulomonas humilata]